MAGLSVPWVPQEPTSQSGAAERNPGLSGDMAHFLPGIGGIMAMEVSGAMRSRLLLRISLSVLALSLSDHPALAHHGWGGNLDQEFELTGTVVTGVSLAGPHATMKIRDSDSKIWDLTLAPPARTARAGLKEGIIPVGATVMIHGHRNRDLNRFEVKTERVTWNSRIFNVYPDRK